MIEKEEEQQQAVIQSPGQILKQARERANLSTQDIAEKIKLKKTLIEDIELDNYDINISLTFVRGYLKLYAKHVYVEETEILNAFDGLKTQKKEPAKLQSFSRRMANQANDDRLMLVTYLIVAAVIALVVIWWFQQSSADTAIESNVSNYSKNLTQSVSTQDVNAQAVLPLEETLMSDAETLTLKNIGENATSDSLSVTSPVLQLQPVIEDQAIDNQFIAAEIVGDRNNLALLVDDIETVVIETGVSTELIFEFSGDCWMNLTDATGENIAYGVKVKGRVMPVTGIPPFVVTLGAPEVVKIYYAGKPIDMSFVPSGRIAKFDLPLSE